MKMHHGEMLGLIKEQHFEKAIDLGSGPCPYESAIPCNSLITVDIKQWDNRVNIVHDIRKPLPFGDEEFDLVVCFDTLYHTPNDDSSFPRISDGSIESLLSEMSRILKPKGKILLTFNMGTSAEDMADFWNLIGTRFITLYVGVHGDFPLGDSSRRLGKFYGEK